MIDGPFAETKEQLLGFYIVDCASLDEAIETAKELAEANPGTGGYEIRPVAELHDYQLADRTEAGGMTDIGWIDAALTAARPQAVGALLRYFRDLDTAEEAFQEACLRALKTWPQNGPPRDPAAWLIFVGRNAAMDDVRRRAKQVALPDEAAISDLDDAESELADRLDGEHYRDDILRLLFICCHPDLPATQQIALALRIVCGLSVKQIARAFLVGEAAMEQRITRAKARIGEAGVPFETPGAVERAERLAAVAAMIYLVFNEGYSARADEAEPRAARWPRRRSGWRACCCASSRSEPEIMGLAALMLLQHARAAARFDAEGGIVLLEDQDRSLWDGKLIAEGLALIDKAMRHRRPGPYQVQAAIAALHARAATGRGHRLGADRPALRHARAAAALAGGDAQPRRGGQQGARARGGAGDDRAAGRPALGLFLLPRREGRPAAAARPPRRGAGGLRPRHRAGQHPRRGRAHPPASRSSGQGERLVAPSLCPDRGPPARSCHEPAGGAVRKRLSRSDCRLPPPVRPWGMPRHHRTETLMTDTLHPVLGGVAPYLGVSDAGKAADFYVKALAATEVIAHAARRKGPLHAHPSCGQWRLADAGRCLPRSRPSAGDAGGFTLHLQVDDADAWWKRAVEAGAEALMPVH